MNSNKLVSVKKKTMNTVSM